MWSSCPWVITNPFTFSILSFRYVTSGMTRSIPSISSSGKARPQSSTIILSSYSKAVIFIPICSNPPRGMIRSFPIFSFLNNRTSIFFIMYYSFCLHADALHLLPGLYPRQAVNIFITTGSSPPEVYHFHTPDHILISVSSSSSSNTFETASNSVSSSTIS